MCFKEWSCLVLGKLLNKALEDEIREAIDKRIGNAEYINYFINIFSLLNLLHSCGVFF